ncbi:MAG: M48 family metalloprotease [Myxococcaceae bacterium]|nr:M48 family metalloprotease [Myxococcaceae bacterium]
MRAATLSTSTLANRSANLLKTGLLLAALSALALALCRPLGGAQGLVLAGGVVLVMNVVSYWFSDRIALAMHGARALAPGELPWLEAMLADVALRANLPRPRLFVIEANTPNAFATGRSPDTAAVAVTTGLLRLLDRRELQGVLAHEVAHVKHRDTLVMTVAATLAGVITHLAQLAFSFGGALLGARRDDEDEGSSALAALGVLLVAPLTATLLQLAISRSREFDADAAAAELTGDPHGLASALSRLEAGNRLVPMDGAAGSSHLFIVNPLSGSGVMGLFATHPPIAARVERLLAMTVGR